MHIDTWAGTPVERQAIREIPQIPLGCICAYTWAPLVGRQVRNGPLASCPADHTAIDSAAAM